MPRIDPPNAHGDAEEVEQIVAWASITAEPQAENPTE
jgi:hypothetical protein